ncbi:hypothetical protein OAH18_01535 [bacterium]|nr:hypothetical protein [bacterium]
MRDVRMPGEFRSVLDVAAQKDAVMQCPKAMYDDVMRDGRETGFRQSYALSGLRRLLLSSSPPIISSMIRATDDGSPPQDVLRPSRIARRLGEVVVERDATDPPTTYVAETCVSPKSSASMFVLANNASLQ